MMIGTQEILLASILLLIVAIIESVFLSKLLLNKWFVKDNVISIFISNIFSAIVGIIGFLGILSEFIFDIYSNNIRKYSFLHFFRIINFSWFYNIDVNLHPQNILHRKNPFFVFDKSCCQ